MSQQQDKPGSESARTMTYSDYLKLGDVLSAQHPHSKAHDEILFIIQHQTSELWMMLVIHELNQARIEINAGHLRPAFKMLTRVARVFDQLNGAWDVLRTMTPSEYTQFREALGSASGLQSFQYRKIEFMLGNRNPTMLKMHEPKPPVHAMLAEELTRPSIYDDAIALLYRVLDGPDAEAPAPQLRQPHAPIPAVQAKWKIVYENVTQYWELYELAEKLVDLEDYFRRWRFNHVTTVERIIGFKRGTGGTSGVKYLRQMLDVELFPELWQVRGDL